MQEGGPSPTLGVGWTNSLCGGPEPPSMERMQPPAQWSQEQGALSLGPLQTSAGGGCLHGEGALPAQHLIMLPSWEETFSSAVW